MELWRLLTLPCILEQRLSRPKQLPVVKPFLLAFLNRFFMG